MLSIRSCNGFHGLLLNFYFVAAIRHADPVFAPRLIRAAAFTDAVVGLCWLRIFTIAQ
jgi:hypothetical protein